MFSAREMVPDTIDGIPTDVIEVGDIVAQSFRQKVRPVKPGYSMGHKQITAGTIGGVFEDKNGEMVLLTNNHVGANENKAKIGDLIYQPGPMDSKPPKYAGWNKHPKELGYVGTLQDFVKLKKKNNLQDSAIVKVHPRYIEEDMVSLSYPVVNKVLKGFGTAKVGSQVQKCGRTTGYTTGKVISLHGSFTIGYTAGPIEFDDCIVLSAMSEGGDSGSMICDMGMRGVGLLFAGSSKVTLANPIHRIVDRYGLELVGKAKRIDTPINTDPKPQGWRKFTKNGTISHKNGIINIKENANQHCYLEKQIHSSFISAMCRVNTGTDVGATWGPGLVVAWGHNYLKLNLRAGNTYGAYHSKKSLLGIGKVTPNTSYDLRIRKNKNTVVGEIRKVGGKWVTVVELSKSVFGADPIAIRFGKTGKFGSTRDYASRGSKMGRIGECKISNIKIT
jgi:hypothetical protein